MNTEAWDADAALPPATAPAPSPKPVVVKQAVHPATLSPGAAAIIVRGGQATTPDKSAEWYDVSARQVVLQRQAMVAAVQPATETDVALALDPKVVPSKESRFAEIQRRLETLERLSATQAPVGLGHNNPHGAIQLPTQDELAPIFVIIRNLEPSQNTSPAAKEAQSRLQRFIDRALDSCADETGKRVAQWGVPLVAVLILAALIELGHALTVWMLANP